MQSTPRRTAGDADRTHGRAASRLPTAARGAAASHAFGLPVALGFPVVGLPTTSCGRDRTPLVVIASGRDALDARWRGAEAEAVYGRRFPDGRVAMLIQRNRRDGHRIWAAGYGTYVVAPQLAELECAPPSDVEPWQWQRFLIGQVLPLVALLRGFEVLHASAVAVEDRVVAFVGAVGAGKSSVAIQLMLRSGGFFCDDVLSLELEGGGVRAHPGPAVANLRPSEARLLRERGALDPLRIVGRDASGLRAVVPREERPLPLDRIYFLDRGWSGTELALHETNDPRLLIGATFNLSIRSPERLARQLEVSSRVAATARMFRARIPARLGAAELAERIEAHVRE
jgi:hypothetical protein